MSAIPLTAVHALKLESTGNRRKWLGGSDAAAIHGMSPWATAVDVYFAKIGEPEKAKTDPEREKRYRRGKRLEPYVIEMLRDEMGLDVVKVSTDKEPNRYVDPEHPFLAAEIDFEWRVRPEDAKRWPWAEALVGTIQNGEVKTADPFRMSEWGQEGTDEVPIHYAFQSMHGLGVMRRDACLYATLFGADNLVTYVMQRDDEAIKAMRARMVDFWHQNVLAKVPPEPQTVTDLERIYVKASRATAPATAQHEQFAAQLLQGLRDRDTAEERIKEAEFQLMHAMGAAEALVTPSGKTLCTWKNSHWTGLNQSALKERHPEVHAEFTETRDIRLFYLIGSRKRKST